MLRLTALLLWFSLVSCIGDTDEASSLLSRDGDADATPETVDPLASTARWMASPPDRAARFSPGGLAPNDRWTFTPTFTPDGRTAYLTWWIDPDLSSRQSSIQELYTSRYVDGRWTPPERVADVAGWRVDFPHVSPDGRRLVVSTTKPHAGTYGWPDDRTNPMGDFDLWMAEREGSEPDGTPRWGPFRPIRSPDVNRQKTPAIRNLGYVHNETAARIGRDGSLLFWTERRDDGGGRRDLYLARPTADGSSWQAPTLLPAPINGGARESGGVLGPDGDWIIFSSERRGGRDDGNLYWSWRTSDGWSPPVRLGRGVNTPANEFAPELTPDGRALLFTSDRSADLRLLRDGTGRRRPPYTVYWVSIDALKASVPAP